MTWIANPAGFVSELVSMVVSVIFMTFTPIFILLISLKSPRIGLFVIIGVVFNLFWQVFMYLGVS